MKSKTQKTLKFSITIIAFIYAVILAIITCLALRHNTGVSKVIFSIIIVLILHIWGINIYALRYMEKLVYYDTLTGLPNLLKIKKDIKHILTHNKEKEYSVLKFDIVNFKVINEIFGFEIANKVLQVPKIVKENANEKSLIVARIYADEYLCFANKSFFANIEERVGFYEASYKEIVPEIKNHKLAFKYGRYNIARGETNVDKVVNKVNLAHSMAKTSKEQLIYDYDDKIKTMLLRDAQITNKMYTALKNNEFKVYLQPKFSLKNEKLIGAEALVRWIENDGNMIFPSEFIPLFEKNGFIVDLDKYILEVTCKTIQSWLNKEYKAIPISTNCSRLNLTKINFVEDIASVADKFNVPHELIDIELTESTTFENEEILVELFEELHRLGFKISIDDFGAGYSSLGILKNLKTDTLKIDKSFFNNDKGGNRGNLLVDGVVKIAHKLNMHVVAEGVETLEQINALKLMGCDAVQGYYYAKPMPITEFEQKYKALMMCK